MDIIQKNMVKTVDRRCWQGFFEDEDVTDINHYISAESLLAGGLSRFAVVLSDIAFTGERIKLLH